MFQLLSKESKIFSVPLYIAFLLVFVIVFNALDFSTINILPTIITFVGVALGYFIFNAVNLTYQTHVPLFLYTFFIFGLYSGQTDFGLAIALLTNSILLLLLTDTDKSLVKSSYLLVGCILALNFLALPATWPMAGFVMLHIISTADRIALQIFRVAFGMVLIFGSYFGLMYFMNYREFDASVLPFHFKGFIKSAYPLYLLAPVAALLIGAVFNHFMHINQKSPKSRFKYTFLLVFTLAQVITIFLYMGNNYEYLLLLALPASIILSRYFRFLPKYWMKEAGFWLVLLCLVLFKAGTYTGFLIFLHL